MKKYFFYSIYILDISKMLKFIKTQELLFIQFFLFILIFLTLIKQEHVCLNIFEDFYCFFIVSASIFKYIYTYIFIHYHINIIIFIPIVIVIKIHFPKLTF